ncbi:c-type cytochrome [Rhizosphaericola mali]|uniref:c-type cytochrome n=1 Tax=Rhizosphaericola mali TaxID=2545455 RepID=UPI00177E4474|nr:c-type cytochrome [Rhizosphaericola mali]
MKKSSLLILASSLFLSALYSCGGNSSEKKEAPTETSAAGDITKDPAYKVGFDLVQTNDCLTCHKVSETATGPAFVDIAKKYTDADIPQLITKIQKGGSGHWGQIPMTPHPNLSQEDATKMLHYIFLLKNQ